MGVLLLTWQIRSGRTGRKFLSAKAKFWVKRFKEGPPKDLRSWVGWYFWGTPPLVKHSSYGMGVDIN